PRRGWARAKRALDVAATVAPQPDPPSQAGDGADPATFCSFPRSRGKAGMGARAKRAMDGDAARVAPARPAWKSSKNKGGRSRLEDSVPRVGGRNRIRNLAAEDGVRCRPLDPAPPRTGPLALVAGQRCMARLCCSAKDIASTFPAQKPPGKAKLD